MSNRSEKEKLKLVQDKCQVILGQLLREEDNKYCVDCDAKGPRWASWNLGIFVCIRCAGIHRNLGVHISRVKSVNLDTWTPEQVACLQQMGNSKARAVYEAYLPDNFRRPQTDSSLEAFIRAKYEQKKYIAKEWVPMPVPKPAFDIEEEHKKDRKKKSNRMKGLATVELPQPPQQVAALPRPHGAPLSSGNSPVASTKSESHNKPTTTTTNACVDLLGLDVPSTDQSGEDLFDAFMSAAPLPTTPASSTTTSQQNGFPAQQSTTNLPQSSLQGGAFTEMPEKKSVMSKESILSLYSTNTNPTPPQPMFGVPGGIYMAPGMYAPQVPQMGWPQHNMGGMVDPLMAQAAAMQNPNVAQPAALNVTNPFLSMGLSGMMGASHPSQMVLDHAAAASNMLATGQVPLGLGQVQQQMAALQLVSQQWQTGAAAMPVYPAAQPSVPAASRPNLQGHTLSTNLWQ